MEAKSYEVAHGQPFVPCDDPVRSNYQTHNIKRVILSVAAGSSSSGVMVGIDDCGSCGIQDGRRCVNLGYAQAANSSALGLRN
jgi:hypothetical protein